MAKMRGDKLKWNIKSMFEKKVCLINHRKAGKKQGNKKQVGQIENKWQDGGPKSNYVNSYIKCF